MAEQLRYPIKNIRNGDDYFKIQVIEYKAPGLNLTGGFALRTTEEALQQSGSIKNSLATIILPMPANIQDSNAADWTTGTMNPLQASLANAASSAVLSDSIAGSIAESIKKFGVNIGSAVATGEGQGGVAAGSAAAAMQAVLGQGNVDSIISRAQGTVFNQNVELLFNGVTMRPAFQFSFDMVPRSQEESIMIKRIIRTFKINMTPQKGKPNEDGGGLFVKAPNVFKLEYMSGGNIHPFLHRFKPCALTQMSVNYNGSNQYATYPDATPVHMNLSLQFQELSPIYKEDYVDDSGNFKLPGTGY
ncbi:hypothetical protein EBR43_03695 [bacterium]|nr:hypothetical protein [bacterium]